MTLYCSPYVESLISEFLQSVRPCRQHRGDWRSSSAQTIINTSIKEPTLCRIA